MKWLKNDCQISQYVLIEKGPVNDILKYPKTNIISLRNIPRLGLFLYLILEFHWSRVGAYLVSFTYTFGIQCVLSIELFIYCVYSFLLLFRIQTRIFYLLLCENLLFLNINYLIDLLCFFECIEKQFLLVRLSQGLLCYLIEEKQHQM